MTIYGWDLSHYDAPDARPAVAEGFAFMTHKAGGDRDDAEIGAWWTFMRPFRPQILLGAYWVLYPGNPAGRADAFIARLDATCPGWRDGPFILQADCEIWNGNPATKPGKAEIKAFCDRLVAKLPKLRPIVYAPEWAYHNELLGLGYPLWESSYVTGTGSASSLYPGDGSARWNVYSGQVPAILQFTSSATIAGQTTCDANAFRGTLAQLIALLAPGWEDDDMIDQIQFNQFMDKYAERVSGFNGETDTTRRLSRLWSQVVRGDDILAAVQAGRLDPAAVVAQVLAGLDPQRIADLVVAALPADQAKRTADELAARLAA